MNSKADLRNTIINFTVDGTAVPKQRPRITRGGQAYTPKKTREMFMKAVNTITF